MTELLTVVCIHFRAFTRGNKSDCAASYACKLQNCWLVVCMHFRAFTCGNRKIVDLLSVYISGPLHVGIEKWLTCCLHTFQGQWRLLWSFEEPGWSQAILHDRHVPFFQRQARWLCAFHLCGSSLFPLVHCLFVILVSFWLTQFLAVTLRMQAVHHVL